MILQVLLKNGRDDGRDLMPTSSRKDSPLPTSCELGMFRFMITFPGALGWVKPRGGGHSQNVQRHLATASMP
jgi:hypothetical protein